MLSPTVFIALISLKGDFLNCLAQGCQVVYFQAKNSNFGILSKALKWNILVHFVTIRYYDVIWCI
jgi:hypothetical protein